MAAQKGRVVPEVIYFEEPSPSEGGVTRRKNKLKERRLFLRGDVTEIYSTNPNQLDASSGEGDDTFDSDLAVDIDIKNSLNEVQCFYLNSLEGKKRRKYLEQRAKQLGGDGHKKVKMPYPKYIELQKRLREREKERSEEMRAGRVLRKKKKQVAQSKVGGRWRDNLKGLNSRAGRMKKGVLTVHKM